MQYIRSWTAQDAKSLAKALNNKKIHDNLRDGLPYPYAQSDAADYIRGVLSASRDSQYSWAIHLNGEAVGSIGIFRKENIHRLTAELGYYVSEPCWGRGLATGAIKEACKHVFEHTDIVRIFAEPFAHNTASCRVLEKAGFELEGQMRSNALKNGNILDMKLYALIR